MVVDHPYFKYRQEIKIKTITKEAIEDRFSTLSIEEKVSVISHGVALRLSEWRKRLFLVESKKQRQLWYDYVERYHYLGYQLPFGAQLRYFIKSGSRDDEIIGYLQFSSPAWKMAPRDKWVGWNEEQRKCNLQKSINNSRFLLFPWVKVKNLASSVLALAI